MHQIVFFGSSTYSLIVLQKLLNLSDFSLSAVVTKIDKPFGRDLTIASNPVAKFAKDHNLNLLQIEDFDENCKLKIKNFPADLGLCVAFGPPFFDAAMINLFPHKIVNIHPSPLPKYRGATPGPWQIINGETTSAVTFFQIDLLPDHGPIITKIPFDISPIDTADSFYQKAFTLAADNLGSILNSYIINHKSLLPQDHSKKSYFPKLSKDSAKIDWGWDTAKIERFVRALIPWPVAWTEVKNSSSQTFKMKIFSFNPELAEGPVEVQIEGKNKTSWPEISKYYQIVR
ncbi:MAG: methionyl-tRNA formyltransferase [Candidatus Shapirobacteria bacterium]|nr:methionyl-tRNA formyltransferase [Candidatus Shapirobacteria bacterium]